MNFVTKKRLTCLSIFIVLLFSVFNLAFSEIPHELHDVEFPCQSKALSAYHSIITAIEKGANIPFAGAYIDDDNYLNVGLTNLNAKNNIDYILNKNRSVVKYFEAKYTLDELRELQSTLFGRLIELGVEGTYVDEINNKVVVAIHDMSRAGKNMIIDAMGQKHQSIMFP